ncbi:DUF1871 family protein [Bacillus lacus]|uniref:DUF1871 family protein n=1 Tax=Metabacillus lacus TaxID=1983721 RepID=A0A7X2J1F8_9BACI|nr:DUF1871 family protein [Metabacillus lacus]MRX73590.1 DUF1871 family protein [Metabacillus lacus]
MELKQANEIMMDLLYSWDPLGYGEGFYETEAVDVLQAVYTIHQPALLARKIQSIYEFSFGRIIPFEECEKTASQLLNIKNTESCSI